MSIRQKWDKMSAAKKSSLALAFAMFFQKGISMISTPVFTRMMNTEQYGQVTNFVSWQTIILILATLNLSQGVFNNGMLDYERDRDRFTLSLTFLSHISTVICLIVYLVLRPYIYSYVDISDLLMLLMLVYMIFTPSYTFWSCRQRYEFKYKALTLITISVSALQMVLGIISVSLVPPEEQGTARIFSTEIVMILVGIFFYIFSLVKAKCKIKKEYVKYAFKFNIFLVPHFLAMNVLNSGDRVMINSMVGSSETAIYGVSYTAASIILIFWQAIEASWTPWLFEHLKNNIIEPIKTRANQLITMFAVVALMCMLFAPEIMAILASGDYSSGIYIIPSVTAGVYFTAVYALYMRLEYYSKKTKATMIGTVSVAILNVFLNYIFIQWMGYIAAGYTTLVCFILLYLFHWFYASKIGMAKMYDNKYILFLSIALCLISIVITFTYLVTVIRYILICVLLILCIVFRKKIIRLVKQIL